MALIKDFSTRREQKSPKRWNRFKNVETELLIVNRYKSKGAKLVVLFFILFGIFFIYINLFLISKSF